MAAKDSEIVAPDCRTEDRHEISMQHQPLGKGVAGATGLPPSLIFQDFSQSATLSGPSKMRENPRPLSHLSIFTGAFPAVRISPYPHGPSNSLPVVARLLLPARSVRLTS